MNVLTLATVLIFVLALLGVITRPRGVSEAVFVLIGAALVVALGVVAPAQAAARLASEWNVFLFFLGLFTVSAVAELAGIFEWLADRAARWSGGSARRLLINVFLLGTVVSVFLSNDATVLILTPIVLTLIARLGLPARPYVFACAFIANAASFTLPVSNPVNIIVLDTYPIPLSSYLGHLLPASVVAVAVNIIGFLVLFRRDLRGAGAVERIGAPETAKRYPAFFRVVAAWLGVTAFAYVGAALAQLPLGVVAAASGVVLVALAWGFGRLSWRRLGAAISWPLFGFIAGLVTLVQALENIGATRLLSRLLLVGGANLAANVATAAVTAAVGSNVMNNLPATFVLTATLGHAGGGATRSALAYGLIVGADLGPNFTIIGSLSTMLWLLILRRRAVPMSALDFLKLGVPVTALTLLGAILALAWRGA